MSASSRGRLSSGLSGGLTGAGTGAAIGSVVPGIGTAIGAGAGFLLGGIGGALTPDEPTGPSPEELQLEQDKLNQDRDQFGLSFKQNQFADAKKFGFMGLQQLAANRAEANANTRRYNFRNDLLAAARGQ